MASRYRGADGAATDLGLSLDRFVESVNGGPRHLTLVARGLDSPLAQAIWPRLRRLRDAGVQVEVILGRAPAANHPMVTGFKTLFGEATLRVANLRRGRVAEQLSFGHAVWSIGLREGPASRPQAVCLGENGPNPATDAAHLAFRLLIALSDPVAPQLQPLVRGLSVWLANFAAFFGAPPRPVPLG